MRSAPDIIDERPSVAPIDPLFLRALENALNERVPVLAPHWPLISRLARFLSVGVVGLATDSGIFALLFHSGSGAPVARATSLVVATVVTWALNRLFTFGPSGRAPLAEMARYFGVALVAQGFNYALFLSLHYATGEARPYACLFVSAVLTTVFSFTGQSFFAFARSSAATRVDA
jgi:putative flippase GtrA